MVQVFGILVSDLPYFFFENANSLAQYRRIHSHKNKPYIRSCAADVYASYICPRDRQEPQACVESVQDSSARAYLLSVAAVTDLGSRSSAQALWDLRSMLPSEWVRL